MRKSIFILVGLIMMAGCTQEEKKQPPAYNVIADQYLGVFLKHAKLYAIADLNGDKVDEVAVVDEREDTTYSLNLYIKSADKWILTNFIPIKNISYGKPVEFREYPVTNLALPVPIPGYNELIALDVDGFPGKEILVPFSGESAHAILVYRVTNCTFLKIAEVSGDGREVLDAIKEQLGK